MRDLWEATKSKEFWLIFGIAVAGYFGLSSWLIVPAALALTLWSRVNDYFSEFQAIDRVTTFVGFWLLTLAQNACFIGGAYVLGIATRWLWGPHA